MPERSDAEPARAFSSDLTRKLVDDVFALTHSPGDSVESLKLEEKQVLGDLSRDFEQLDKGMRQDLAELASLLADEEGHALRAAICRPGKAEIKIDETCMEATLLLQGPMGGGKPLSLADVVAILREVGVVFGVDLPAITSAVNDVARAPSKPLHICIAFGKHPVDGAPGRFELPAGAGGQTSSGQPPTKRRQWMVKKGDILATKISPTAGISGTDVFGRVVPAALGAEAVLPMSDDIFFDTERQAYVATFDGLASFDGKQLELRRHFVWTGDLTMHDPPIVFEGSVIIHGTVRDGASISAAEDIQIDEGIEGATIISSAGSVTARLGIAGHGRAYVSAKKSVDVKYAENATVYCEGDILVRHAVLHSRLTAGRRIHVELGKGAVFGGEIRAGELIAAKSFGNVSGVPTRISVGYSWESLRQLQACEANLAALRQKGVVCEELVAKFRRARPQFSSLSTTEKLALGELLKRHLLLQSRIHREEAALRDLDAGCVLESSGEIRCHETLHSGVIVKMGNATVHLSVCQTACVLHLHREERKIFALFSSGRKTYLT